MQVHVSRCSRNNYIVTLYGVHSSAKCLPLRTYISPISLFSRQGRKFILIKIGNVYIQEYRRRTKPNMAARTKSTSMLSKVYPHVQIAHNQMILTSYLYPKHYGRIEIPRVSQASPSAKNRALGEASLPRVLHSGKRGFPECRSLPGTRGRTTLRKDPLPRAQHSGKSRTRGRKVLLDGPN
jgi:hypothetical protein